MSQLKTSFLINIKRALANSQFSEGDFSLNTPSAGYTYLEIFFKYNNDYTFEVTRNNDFIQITTRPGKYKIQDSTRSIDFGDILGAIREWTIRIRDELEAQAKSISKDPLEEMRKEFEKKFDERLGGDTSPEKTFSESEIYEIDTLLDRFYEKLEALQKELELNKNEMNGFKKELAELKEAATFYPKGAWRTKAKNKMFHIMSSAYKSKPVQIAMEEGIKLLIKNTVS